MPSALDIPDYYWIEYCPVPGCGARACVYWRPSESEAFALCEVHAHEVRTFVEQATLHALKTVTAGRIPVLTFPEVQQFAP